jgi:hypothetical protein
MVTRDAFSGRSWRNCRASPVPGRGELIRYLALAAAGETFVRKRGRQ